MTRDDIRDLAILVTEHLLDKAPHLLDPSVHEVDNKYTQETFDLQDEIYEGIFIAQTSRQ